MKIRHLPMPHWARRHAVDWLALWGAPGFESRITLEFSSRMTRFLGRCYPERRLIRLSERLLHGPRGVLEEALCHELAHIAVFELNGRNCRPHGPEWKVLMQRGGLRAAHPSPLGRRPTAQKKEAPPLPLHPPLSRLPRRARRSSYRPTMAVCSVRRSRSRRQARDSAATGTGSKAHVRGNSCPFCEPDSKRIFHKGRRVVGLWDNFPVTPGHTLLITKRHVATWFDATVEERSELLAAIDIARDEILSRHQPDGFNIGINVGEAAGQTIFHLHLHVIPRYRGDVEDPTGGVRHVIPSKANYLRSTKGGAQLSAEPGPSLAIEDVSTLPHTESLIRGEDDPLLPHLLTHLDEAERADVAVAFVLESGVNRIEQQLSDLLDRGGRVRLLTGDYLGITDPRALLRLLDLREGSEGELDLRVFECQGQSFHPKAYVFHFRAPLTGGVAYLGSSNLSAQALEQGVEWNYRIIPSEDREGFRSIIHAFDELFHHKKTRPVDPEWIRHYRSTRKPPPTKAPVEIEREAPPPPPEPHSIQKKALKALERTRAEGNQAGLVVLATGLGKTWLAAFDSVRFEAKRVLFVAHREEILRQSLRTFRRIRPEATFGFYTGKEKIPEADVLFASIQTLGRKAHLRQFQPEDFDYIVVDEFHHAAARSYRQLIDYFEPRFLLGLTATPERTDGGDLLALCGENLVFRRDLTVGIREGLLCPFHYYGVPDEVDYQNIPWRNGRFKEEELTKAVATQKRAENALEQYRHRAGSRTLAFCCSQLHADFMNAFFSKHDIRAAVVHSGPLSAPRATTLEKLNEGELDVVFAVDMFNEGVDLPNVDTIMMLRPTESRILWLQQFGRGLRVSEGKDHLRVIDYIGNHRAFLLKPEDAVRTGTG